MHTDFALRPTKIDFSLEVKLWRCYAYHPRSRGMFSSQAAWDRFPSCLLYGPLGLLIGIRNIHDVYELGSLLRENITMVGLINLQKAKIIVVYSTCNPSRTKQQNASNTNKKMPYRKKTKIYSNPHYYAMRCHLLFTSKRKQTCTWGGWCRLAKRNQAAWLLKSEKCLRSTLPPKSNGLFVGLIPTLQKLFEKSFHKFE